MLREHDVVTVTAELPDQALAVGDVGAVVHCYPQTDTYEVEFLDERGRSKGVVTVSGEHLLRLNLISLCA